MMSLTAKAFWVSVAVIAATFIPYIAGWSIADGAVFFANYDASPTDPYAYYSLMEQARQGEWLFWNAFTFEGGNGVWLHPLWLLFGKLSGTLHIPTIVFYHVARAAAGLGLLMAIFWLTRWATQSARSRLVLFVYAATAAGFSWMITPFVWGHGWGQEGLFFLVPTDAWVTESITFTTLMHTPLFAISQMLLLAVLLLYFRNLEQASARSVALTMLSVFVLALIHPYDIFIVFAVMLVHGVVFWLFARGMNWRRLWAWGVKVFLYGLPAVVVAAYMFWVMDHDLGMKLWAEQNITTSPPLSTYIMGYGWMWVGLVLFAVYAWKRGFHRKEMSLLVAWLIAVAILVYAPTDINRRFTHGAHIPFALVSGYGFLLLYRFMKKRFGMDWSVTKPLVWMVIILMAGTTIHTVARGVSTASKKRAIQYAPAEFADAAAWANENTGMHETFWMQPTRAAQWTGLTGRTVYMGHGHQTYRFYDKLNNSKIFWWFGSPAQQEAFLATMQPDYFILTDLDGWANPDFVYSTGAHSVVYENAQFTIYRYNAGASVTSEISNTDSGL